MILTLVSEVSTAEENSSLNLETGDSSNNSVVGFIPWMSLFSHSKLKRNEPRAACFLDCCQVHYVGNGFVQIHSLKFLPNPEYKQSAALSMTPPCFELLLPVPQKSRKAGSFLSNM